MFKSQSLSLSHTHIIFCRPVENEYTKDWEYERSNYVKHQVFSEESSGLIHAKLAAGEDEHQVTFSCMCLLILIKIRQIIEHIMSL